VEGGSTCCCVQTFIHDSVYARRLTNHFQFESPSNMTRASLRTTTSSVNRIDVYRVSTTLVELALTWIVFDDRTRQAPHSIAIGLVSPINGDALFLRVATPLVTTDQYAPTFLEYGI
jgi:hypothetical protein